MGKAYLPGGLDDQQEYILALETAQSASQIHPS